MTKKKEHIERGIEIAVHILTWCYIFLSPLMFKRSGESINWPHFLHGSLLPLMVCIAFYTNYLLLVPRILLKQHKLNLFLFLNLIIFCTYQIIVEFQGFLFSHGYISPPTPPALPKGVEPYFPPKAYFILRGFLTFAFTVGVSVALRTSMNWRKSEKERAESELQRSLAELKNLKNQINPHFLLNTLNNIYALTTFDHEKAQRAITRLSSLLRYMLYDNQAEWVTLNQEIEFLKSYIALMRLRVMANVEIKTYFEVPEQENMPIAPLIFISLVENAFKHGVSPTEKSFVHVSLQASRERIVFRCINSYFPKDANDKSPGGIGLQQVERRLALSYPGRYVQTCGLSEKGDVYISEIIITNKQLK